MNYVGYFSSHEQSMETVVNLQSSMTESELTSIFRKAAVHCRRDQLWKNLHDGICNIQRHCDQIDYTDFQQKISVGFLKIYLLQNCPVCSCPGSPNPVFCGVVVDFFKAVQLEY